MTNNDKSTIQRMLGIIEGIGLSLDERLQPTFMDSIVVIDQILSEECVEND